MVIIANRGEYIQIEDGSYKLLSIEKIDLKNYPEFFFKESQLDCLFVLGRNAKAQDSISLNNILLGIMKIPNEGIQEIPSTSIRFDDEVANPTTAQNLISVGGACVNSITASLLNNSEICSEGTKEGEGIIKLIENNGLVQVLVYGGTKEDTNNATRVLQNWEFYNLSGTEIVVRKDGGRSGCFLITLF